MNILILICDYMPSSKKVTAKMFHELAKECIARGHVVSCVTPKQGDDEAVSSLDDVNVYRFKSGPVKNTNLVVRLLNEWQFSRRAWRTIKKNKSIQPDLVVWTSPSVFWGQCVKKIVKRFKSRAYLVLRDFFPQWVIDKGIISANSFPALFFRHYEKMSYDAASHIGVMSPNNLSYFNQFTHGRYQGVTDVLYNWVDQHFLAEIEPNLQFRTQYSLQDKVLFIYGGNIGWAQDMGNVIRLANRMQSESKAHFVLIGQGDEYSLVKKMIQELQLSNVLLLPAVNQESYFAIQKVCDVGLFTLHKAHKTHNFPGKLLGYMAQGMPILGAVNPGNDLMLLINENQAGFVSIAGDDNSLYEHGKQLCNNQSLREVRGQNAHALIESYFSVQTAADKILNEAI